MLNNELNKTFKSVTAKLRIRGNFVKNLINFHCCRVMKKLLIGLSSK